MAGLEVEEVERDGWPIGPERGLPGLEVEVERGGWLIVVERGLAGLEVERDGWLIVVERGLAGVGFLTPGLACRRYSGPDPSLLYGPLEESGFTWPPRTSSAGENFRGLADPGSLFILSGL